MDTQDMEKTWSYLFNGDVVSAAGGYHFRVKMLEMKHKNSGIHTFYYI